MPGAGLSSAGCMTNPVKVQVADPDRKQRIQALIEELNQRLQARRIAVDWLESCMSCCLQPASAPASSSGRS